MPNLGFQGCVPLVQYNKKLAKRVSRVISSSIFWLLYIITSPITMTIIYGVIAYAGLAALTIGYFVVKKLGDRQENQHS